MAVRGGYRAGRSECLAAVITVEPCLVPTQGVLRNDRQCRDKATDLSMRQSTRRGASISQYASIGGTLVLDAQQLPSLPVYVWGRCRLSLVTALLVLRVCAFRCRVRREFGRTCPEDKVPGNQGAKGKESTTYVLSVRCSKLRVSVSLRGFKYGDFLSCPLRGR